MNFPEFENHMSICFYFFAGKVWLTYGEQNSARLCKVTCEEGVMYDLGMGVSFHDEGHII